MNAIASEKEDIYSQIQRCQGQIDIYQAEIDKLEDERREVDRQLEEFADERRTYELLGTLSDNLEQLAEMGANALFWDGLVEDAQVNDKLKELRDKAARFESEIKKVTDKRENIHGQINSKQAAIDYLLDDIEELKEREEESKDLYVIEREIHQLPVRVMVMPWTKKDEDEKRYRKILLLCLLICIFVTLVIPQIKYAIQERPENRPIPDRFAKLIKKQPPPKPKPKPKPKEAKPEKKEKEKTEKKPTKTERQNARKRVAHKGVLAFRNNLANLLNDEPEAKLGASANLNNKGSSSSHVSRHILTSQAKSGSGGIRTSSLSHDVSGTGKKMAAVAFTRVKSDIGTAAADDRPLSDSPGPTRTDEEIQIVFDRYKAALYRIYNRELRVNPTLQGKLVMRITIEPDGSVSKCKMVSTDLASSKLVRKILARVKMFNFGKKAGVPRITILYPIDFLPAS